MHRPANRLPAAIAMACLTALALASPRAKATCSYTAQLTETQDALSRSRAVYPDLDPTSAEGAWLQARASLLCLAEPVAPDLALQLHFSKGLADLANDRTAGAEAAFAAVRGIDQTWTLPPPKASMTGGAASSPAEAVARTQRAFGALSLHEAKTEPVPAPAPGVALMFDGQESLERRTTLPTVFQVLDDSDTVRVTAYLEPGDPLPSYPHMALSDRSATFLSGAQASTWAGAIALGAGFGLATYTASVMAFNCSWDGGAAPETCWGSDPTDNRAWLTGFPIASGALLGLGAGGLVTGKVLRRRADHADSRLEVTGSF